MSWTGEIYQATPAIKDCLYDITGGIIDKLIRCFQYLQADMVKMQRRKGKNPVMSVEFIMDSATKHSLIIKDHKGRQLAQKISANNTEKLISTSLINNPETEALLQENEAERLSTVLSDSAEYLSEFANTTYVGKKEIIDRLNYVYNANKNRQFLAYFATITGVDDGDEVLPYGVGEKCIVIAIDEISNLDSICFMECDTDNKISKITVTRNPRYHFRIDQKTRPLNQFEFKPPQTYYKPIINRARFHCFIESEMSKEEIETSSKKRAYYEEAARIAVNCFNKHSEENGNNEE
jgi:hypothetical protein